MCEKCIIKFKYLFAAFALFIIYLKHCMPIIFFSKKGHFTNFITHLISNFSVSSWIEDVKIYDSEPPN